MGISRTVLVTGGARGIGKGIAKSFLEANHSVMIADLGGVSTDAEADWAYDLSTDADTAATLAELDPLGNVSYAHVDVTDAASCRAAVQATLDTFGRLDVLVNNAGILDTGRIDEFTEAQWDRVFAVNVKGVFLMTQAAVASLRQSADAAIVNIASIAGKRGAAQLAAYCGSKFAVVGITQSFAQEFARDGIRVNAVCPGMVGTAMWLDHLMANRGEAAFDTRMEDLIPLGRPQTAEDMGQAAVYLASAPNVSGIALNVAGAYEMH